MDNLTHSLAGAVLGQAGLKAKTRKGMAALILGANGPDIDVFLGWVSWLPLATHRGFTHGVVGVLIVMPLLIAGLLWLIDDWQVRRGKAFEGQPAMDLHWLLGLAFIGCLTHPLFDLQTVYAVQLLSPFSTNWFHTDTLFIIDIWLLVMLGTGVWRSRRSERAGGAWRKPAIAACAAALAYIGLNGLITAKAIAGVRTFAPGYDRIAASPPPLAFWRRDLVWREGGGYARSRYDPLTSPSYAPVFGRQSAAMDNPTIRRAIDASPDVQRFLRWSIMPFATVANEGCQTKVTFNDARYSDARRATFEHVVMLQARDCP